MKKIYYEPGPPTIKAGIAGQFRAGFAKPVSDKAAGLLLNRDDILFHEAGPDTPLDDAFDQAELEKIALELDAADAAEAAAEAAEAAPVEKPAGTKKGR
jgi:hypothetical protein